MANDWEPALHRCSGITAVGLSISTPGIGTHSPSPVPIPSDTRPTFATWFAAILKAGSPAEIAAILLDGGREGLPIRDAHEAHLRTRKRAPPLLGLAPHPGRPADIDKARLRAARRHRDQQLADLPSRHCVTASRCSAIS